MQLQVEDKACKGVEVEGAFGQKRTYRTGPGQVIEVPDRDAQALLKKAPVVSKYTKTFAMGVEFKNGQRVWDK